MIHGSPSPLPLRQRRAARLREISERLLREHSFGTRGYLRSRHALYLATLLEMRGGTRLLGRLRRGSKRDLREHRWYDSPHPDEVPTIDAFGELVLGVDVQDPSAVQVGL
jgi:hypothetical protein